MIDFIIKKFLKKNIKFENKFKNDDCYIFGNGASLKNYDLKFFKAKNVIACNWMLLHNDFKHFEKVQAYVELTPFWFFPYNRHPYSKKFKINNARKLFKSNLKGLNFPLFISISNLLFLNNSNTYFLHDFGNKKLDLNNYKINEKFSLMGGAFYASLGIAKFMGFKKIYLVGFDYWMTEPIIGHFYEKKLSGLASSENFISIKNEKQKSDLEFINQLNKDMDLTMICPNNYNSNLFKSVNYSDFFKCEEKMKSNEQIVSMKNLISLSKLNWQYEIF